MQAFALWSCCSNKCTSKKPHPRSRSQDNVVRDTLEYGLAMDNEVAIIDGDVRCHCHLLPRTRVGDVWQLTAEGIKSNKSTHLIISIVEFVGNEVKNLLHEWMHLINNKPNTHRIVNLYVLNYSLTLEQQRKVVKLMMKLKEYNTFETNISIVSKIIAYLVTIITLVQLSLPHTYYIVVPKEMRAC